MDINKTANTEVGRGAASIWGIFTHVASIYANLLEQKKAFT